MIDAQTHLEAVAATIERVAIAAKGRLSDNVPSCPDYDLHALLVHMATFADWVTKMAKTGEATQYVPVDAGDDVIATYGTYAAGLVDALAARNPDDEMWSWGNDQHARFWYRRAAQELTVHTWDVENVAGKTLPIEPTLAADGVDEYLTEFRGGIAARYQGDGEVHRFVAADTGEVWTVTIRPSTLEDTPDATPLVTASGTANDLLLYLWGRIGPDRFTVDGDAALLDRWQQRVKI